MILPRRFPTESQSQQATKGLNLRYGVFRTKVARSRGARTPALDFLEKIVVFGTLFFTPQRSHELHPMRSHVLHPMRSHVLHPQRSHVLHHRDGLSRKINGPKERCSGDFNQVKENKTFWKLPGLKATSIPNRDLLNEELVAIAENKGLQGRIWCRYHTNPLSATMVRALDNM